MKPNKKQINPFPGDLDGDYAVKNWLGKSVEDGVKMLASNSLHYCEDFTYMGKLAYNYYFDAIIEYAKSEESKEDCDFINGIIGSAIELRWEQDRKVIESSRGKIILFLEYVISNYKKYDVDVDIYGDLKQKSQDLKKQIEA